MNPADQPADGAHSMGEVNAALDLLGAAIDARDIAAIAKRFQAVRQAVDTCATRMGHGGH